MTKQLIENIINEYKQVPAYYNSPDGLRALLEKHLPKQEEPKKIDWVVQVEESELGTIQHRRVDDTIQLLIDTVNSLLSKTKDEQTS